MSNPGQVSYNGPVLLALATAIAATTGASTDKAESMKPEAGPRQLVFSEPEQWFSQLDEGMFYRALYAITSIKSLEKVPKSAPDDTSTNWIVVSLNSAQFDENSLKNMLGLMRRYDLDLSVLASQCTPMNERWFKSKDAPWYKAVFAEPVTA